MDPFRFQHVQQFRPQIPQLARPPLHLQPRGQFSLPNVQNPMLANTRFRVMPYKSQAQPEGHFPAPRAAQPVPAQDLTPEESEAREFVLEAVRIIPWGMLERETNQHYLCGGMREELFYELQMFLHNWLPSVQRTGALCPRDYVKAAQILEDVSCCYFGPLEDV